MKRGVLALCAISAFGLSTTVRASQLELPAPSARPPGPSNKVLGLPALLGPTLPAAPPVLQKPEVPSPFLGCWTASPDKFDSVVSSFGGVTVGSPGKIVFCYRADHIEVPEAEISFSAGDWIKNVAFHLGLGVTTATIDPQGITTSIYEITDTQIHARTFIPMDVTERLLYLLPITKRQTLVDEELATLINSDTILLQARQELDIRGMQSVRMWHAEFHRISQ
jgi:hypothetical protein